MSRWIDADAVIQQIANKEYDKAQSVETFDMVNRVCDLISNAPTIELCEDAISRANAIEQIINTTTLNQNKGQEFLEGCATRQNEIIDILKALSPVAPSRRGGDWIDLFEEIGNTIDTIGDGQETEAFNRGVEACAEIVRRFFGLDMSKESGR